MCAKLQPWQSVLRYDLDSLFRPQSRRDKSCALSWASRTELARSTCQHMQAVVAIVTCVIPAGASLAEPAKG